MPPTPLKRSPSADHISVQNKFPFSTNSHFSKQEKKSKVFSMACIKLNSTSFQTSMCQFIHLLAFTFLLFSTLSPFSYMAQARHFIKHDEDNVRRDEEKGVNLMMRQLMGSKPPKCGKRCNSCGHCEAVQVPIVPIIKKSLHKKQHQLSRIAYSRGDDISNYKPMCWKCKCGDFFFNPW